MYCLLLCTLWVGTTGSVGNLKLVGMVLSGPHELLEPPWRLRELVGLGLTTATTVRMVVGVHGHTSDLGTETPVSVSTGLTPVGQSMRLVGHRAQRGTAVQADVPLLARAQLDDGSVLVGFFREQTGKSSSGTHQLAASVGMQAHVVHHRSHGHHAQGHAVASLHDSGVQERLVDLAVVGSLHLLDEISRKPQAKRLDAVASTDAQRRQDV